MADRIDLNRLCERAQIVCNGGTEALRDWWLHTLTKAERVAMEPYKPRLKQVAAEFDKER